MTEDLINKGLSELQDELLQLDSAVKQIDRAGQIATSVVNAVKEIQARTASYTQEVLDNYSTYLHKTSLNVQDNISELTKVHLKETEQISLLLQNIQDLKAETSALLSKINSIEFEKRLNDFASQLNILIQALATQQSVSIANANKHSQGLDSVFIRISSLSDSISANNLQNTKLFNEIIEKNNQLLEKKFKEQNKKLWNIKGLIYVLIFVMMLFLAMTLADNFGLFE